MDVSMFSTVVLPVSIIAGLCLAVAALAINIGEWKIRMGLLLRFKSLALPRRHQRRSYRSSSAGDPARARSVVKS
jgi:hypothetical protein